jgi:hypothetical protein
MELKQPLAIFVLWHHDNNEAEKYANLIFSELRRNANDPLSRGMNIPVFFRSHETILAPIQVEKYEQVVIISLVEARFVNDNRYRDYLREYILRNDRKILVIPVALSKSALNAGIRNINFVRLYDVDSKDNLLAGDKESFLIGVLGHEIARHLYDWHPSDDNDAPPKPLTLFISHAKVDGVEFARRIQFFLAHEHSVKTFFDANDITKAYDFTNEIERNIKKAIVIAIHTDAYSSREWCRREVLLAKQNNRPLVILNCLKSGETRSFPYMANVLTVHYLPMDESAWGKLIAAIMKETLRFKFHEKWITYVLSKKQISLSQNIFISSYPPELFTVMNLTQKVNMFIYPEPPLGTEEMNILTAARPNVKFVTPTEL